MQVVLYLRWRINIVYLQTTEEPVNLPLASAAIILVGTIDSFVASLALCQIVYLLVFAGALQSASSLVHSKQSSRVIGA